MGGFTTAMGVIDEVVLAAVELDEVVELDEAVEFSLEVELEVVELPRKNVA